MAVLDRRGVVVSATDPAQGSDPNPGLAIKTPVRAATTANILLAGLQTIDQVALVAGDRVLVKDQVDQTLNGIYTAAPGLWPRASDANSNSAFGPGMLVYVLEGFTHSGKAFQLANTSPVLLGTTAIVWTAVAFPFSAIGFVIDGGGVPIQTGQKDDIEIPFACTIYRVTLLADVVGSIVVDLWRSTFAGFPPTVANSLCGSARPTLSAAQKYQDAGLAGWSRVLATGDIIRPNIISTSGGISRLTASLLVTRN